MINEQVAPLLSIIEALEKAQELEKHNPAARYYQRLKEAFGDKKTDQEQAEIARDFLKKYGNITPFPKK